MKTQGGYKRLAMQVVPNTQYLTYNVVDSFLHPNPVSTQSPDVHSEISGGSSGPESSTVISQAGIARGVVTLI
jgi:hypothetical protein